MKLTKIFFHSFWIVGFLALMFCGILLSVPAKNNVAKADDEVPIIFHALSTNETMFGAKDNGEGWGDYVDLIFDKTGSTYTLSGGYSEDPSVKLYDIVVTDTTNLGNYLGGDYPTKFVDGKMLNANNEEVTITDLTVNGISVGPQTGWFYEASNVSSVITLTSLWKEFDGNLPSNFIATGEIHLYCIFNPFSVTLNSGELGKFYSGTTTITPTILIPYLSQQTIAAAPKPNDESKYRFDGYFTQENGGGERITNQYGGLEQPWTRNLSNIYAHYVEIFHITYHYHYSNKYYTGMITYDKFKDGVTNTIATDAFTLSVTNGSHQAKPEGGSAENFPTDKVVAGWFSKDGYIDENNEGDWGTKINSFNPTSLPSGQNTFEVWARLAETAYWLTFDANGGTFWDGETTKQFLCDYNSTLASALTKLETDAGGNDLATRVGYNFNKNEWVATQDGTFVLSINSTRITDTTTVYLKWTAKPCRITYMTNGTFALPGLLKDSNNNLYQDVPYGTNLYEYLDPNSSYITNPKDGNKLENPGYNFIGWAFANADMQNGFELTRRPTGTTAEANGVQLTFVQPTDTMPVEGIIVHSVWIKSYTIRLRLNQGTLDSSVTSNLKVEDKKTIILTIENNETFGKALERMGVEDFLTADVYKPALTNCTFVGWCYYKDGNITNNADDNTVIIDNKYLNMDIETLAAHNIDLTTDATVAAKYKYNTTDPFYTKAPSDTTSVIFAIILMIISIALLVMLILNHKNNGIIEINDKAIEAYKNIYGEDAPLPTFEATKPPFEVNDDIPTKNNNNDEQN